MEQPSYYAIIPANIRYDKNLKANEKLLYGEITALSNKNGYCTASNSYFSELYSVTKTSVSKWISNLEKNNYIKVELVYNEKKEIILRKLFIKSTPIEEKLITPIEDKLNTYITKVNDPIEEKLKGNNTSNNITSNNNTNMEKNNTPSLPNFESEKKKEKEEEELFNEFWKEYPNKKGKHEAKLKFGKVLKNIPFDELMRCVKRMKSENREIRYYPYGGTFLNSKYEDYTDDNFSESNHITSDNDSEIYVDIPKFG